MTTTLSATDLPFDEAIAYLRQKANVTSEDYTDVWGKANVKSFTVAGATTRALVDDFRAEVSKALENGTSLQEFRKSFDALVTKHGWDHTGSPGWRSRIIYETNLGMAYSAGRYAQQTEPETLAAFPYWQYVHSGALHPRKQHQAWNGLCLRADDPFWETHYPPNGWRCGCRTRPLSARGMARQGKSGPDKAPPLDMREHLIKKTGEVIQVPAGIDPGFGYNPGREWTGRAPQIPANATLTVRGRPPEPPTPPPAPPPPAPPPTPPKPPVPPAPSVEADPPTVVPAVPPAPRQPIPPAPAWPSTMPRTPSPLPAADLVGLPEAVAKWQRESWVHVDDVLRRAINRKGPPRLLPSAARGAYHLNGGIMMSDAHAARAVEDRAVTWRHEFGHYIDYERGGYRSPKVAAEAMEESLGRWRTAQLNLAPDRLAADATEKEIAEHWAARGVEGVTLEDLRALAPTRERLVGLVNAIDRGEPERFLKAWAPRTDAERTLQLMVSDFIEAVSRCKFGGMTRGVGGHGRAYYKKFAAIPQSSYTEGHALEAFANWVSIRSGALQQVKVLLARMAPETVESLETVLARVASV